jgi:hypothetical protein
MKRSHSRHRAHTTRRLAHEIGNARVVALGELSHFGAATFDLKLKLVEYLHSELGFNRVILEAGLFSCQEAAAAMRRGMPSQDAARLCLFERVSAGQWLADGLGNDYFAIAVSAAPSMLEHGALGGTLQLLPRSALIARGKSVSLMMGAAVDTAQWGNLFDAVLVLPRERPVGARVGCEG